jgi:hypothetical protein
VVPALFDHDDIHAGLGEFGRHRRAARARTDDHDRAVHLPV